MQLNIRMMKPFLGSRATTQKVILGSCERQLAMAEFRVVRAVLTHSTTEESRQSISADLRIAGHLEERNLAVRALEQKVVWTAAHSPSSPCCGRFGRYRINISLHHLEAVAERQSWKVLRPVSDRLYKSCSRHVFYTILLTYSAVPSGWREVEPSDEMQLHFTDSFYGLEVKHMHAKTRQHCHVAIAVDELSMIASKTNAVAQKGLPSYLNDLQLHAVGRQYYTDCKCQRDLVGEPCCRMHCDELFQPSASITLLADFENEEDLLAIKVLCNQKHVGHIAWFDCLLLHLLWRRLGGFQVGEEEVSIELGTEEAPIKLEKIAITSAGFQRYVGGDDQGSSPDGEDLYNRNYAVHPALLSLPLPLPQQLARVPVRVKAREGYTPQYNRASPYFRNAPLDINPSVRP